MTFLEICRDVIGKLGWGGCYLGLGCCSGDAEAGVVLAWFVGGGDEDVILSQASHTVLLFPLANSAMQDAKQHSTKQRFE